MEHELTVAVDVDLADELDQIPIAARRWAAALWVVV